MGKHSNCNECYYSHSPEKCPSNSKSEDTSLDDLLSTLTDDFRRWLEPQLLAWHKAEVAKLLQVIEDEVLGDIEEKFMISNTDSFRHFQRQALKKIKERYGRN